jgi:hypothetical protein
MIIVELHELCLLMCQWFSIGYVSKSTNVLGDLGGVETEAHDLNGFYHNGKPKVYKIELVDAFRFTALRSAFYASLLVGANVISSIHLCECSCIDSHPHLNFLHMFYFQSKVQI